MLGDDEEPGSGVGELVGWLPVRRVAPILGTN